MKTCDLCGVRKWLDAYRKKNRGGGYRSTCTACSRARHAEATGCTPRTAKKWKPRHSGSTEPALWAEHVINGNTYLGELAAQRYVNRGTTTLWDWRRRGSVVARKIKVESGYVGWAYHRGSLRQGLRDADRRSRERLRVGGGGRGRKGPQSPEKLAAARLRAEAKRAARERVKRDRRAAMRAAAEEAERLDDLEWARTHPGE